MDAIRWLEDNAQGFAELSREEREAPMHFSLVWSYFEAVALQTRGSSAAIDRFVNELAVRGQLIRQEIAPCLLYFRRRYFDGEAFTHHFASLNLRANDNRPLVESVLSGREDSDVSVFIASLTVIYRFRNNFLHGNKWSYQLRDQLENFQHATSVLIAVLGMARRAHA